MDDHATPRRVGVLGGTFDPIHLGHLVAASEVLNALDLDRVVFVPAGRPWQKTSYSEGEDRFMMTVLAVAGHSRFSASRIELDRRGPTYTADTLEAMRDFWGEGTSLYFITGADAAAALGTWRDLDRLGSVAEIVAVSRKGWSLGALESMPGWPRVHSVEMPLIEISGTEVRARVATGRPIDFLVPGDVATYIREHGLYERAPEATSA